MRPIGFSTGALAKGDFEAGVALQHDLSLFSAIELSALREHELPVLVDAVRTLDMTSFAYVSFHAPSRLLDMQEETLFEMLNGLPESWPIIMHPEVIQTPFLWRELGSR